MFIFDQIGGGVTTNEVLTQLGVTMAPYGEHDLIVSMHLDDGFGQPGVEQKEISKSIQFLVTPMVAGRTYQGAVHVPRQWNDHLECRRKKKQQQEYLTFSSASKAKLPTAEGTQNKLTMGVLVHRGGKSFSSSVASWFKSGLPQHVDEILIYLQEWPFKSETGEIEKKELVDVANVDARLLDLWLLSKEWSQAQDKNQLPHILVIGARAQVNIAPAFASLVQMSTFDLFMFVEEDFSIHRSFLTNQHLVGDRLNKASMMLSLQSHPHGDIVNVVQLRSNKHPGAPDCARTNWRGKERDMLFVQSGDIARHKVLSSTSWLENPSLIFPPETLWRCSPRLIQEVEIKEMEIKEMEKKLRDKKEEEEYQEEDFWCSFSTHAGWTNNPFMARRKWLLDVIVPIALADWTRRVESAVCLSPSLWDYSCYVVAASKGLFTHDDVDKPMSEQSPCEAPSSQILEL